MTALSSSMVASVSTTKTKAMITMMMSSSVVHMAESPSTSSRAYPMPWLESASTRSSTRASASVKASTMSFSASVRSATERSRSLKVNE